MEVGVQHHTSATLHPRGKGARCTLYTKPDALEQRKMYYPCRDSNPDSPDRTLVPTWPPTGERRVQILAVHKSATIVSKLRMHSPCAEMVRKETRSNY